MPICCLDFPDPSFRPSFVSFAQLPLGSLASSAEPLPYQLALPLKYFFLVLDSLGLDRLTWIDSSHSFWEVGHSGISALWCWHTHRWIHNKLYPLLSWSVGWHRDGSSLPTDRLEAFYFMCDAATPPRRVDRFAWNFGGIYNSTRAIAWGTFPLPVGTSKPEMWLFSKTGSRNRKLKLF